MSCIVRDQENKIILMCKGADTVITERLTEKSRAEDLPKTEEFVNAYAKEGLRTLYLAETILDENEYNTWNEESK